MAVQVGAWNLQEGLAIAGRSNKLVEAILRRDNDVMILSDAYWLGNPELGADEDVAEDAFEVLHSEGYEAVSTEYDDDLQWPQHYMVALSRVALSGMAVVKLDNRNALSLKVAQAGGSNDLHILGAHFDDRTENRRLAQAYQATEHLSGNVSGALIGDLNAMHGSDRLPRLLYSKAFGKAARYVPNERGKLIAECLHYMGKGSTFRMLESKGFRDVDPAHKPSMPARTPLFHLDRCFVSDHVEAYDFQVAPYNAASDHRAIQVTLET